MPLSLRGAKRRGKPFLRNAPVQTVFMNIQFPVRISLEICNRDPVNIVIFLC